MEENNGPLMPMQTERAKMTIPSHLESSASEVLVRTMAGDLERLGQTGGLAGVSFSHANVSAASENAAVLHERKKINPLLIIVIVAGVLGLFLLGFFLPRLFTSPTLKTPANQGVSQTQAPTGNTGALPQNSGTASGGGATTVSPAHQSFFATPTEEAVLAHLSSLDTTPLSDQLIRFFARLDAGATFFELAIDTDNVALGWSELLGVMGADLMPSYNWKDHFQDDVTVFVYHDKSGYWPGYVLKLKDKELPLIVQPQILSMEGSSVALAKLFMKDQGAISGSFSDGQIAGQPVRTARFGVKGATMSYGFFYGKYLVITTSDAGLTQAIKNL